jgi:hypothetical protein
MKIVIKVALIALLWITAINKGSLNGDTLIRLKMAHAWWTGTEEVAPNYQPKLRGDLDAGVIGVEGKRYIAYDVGQSMLMLPGDWLGTQLHRWFPQFKEIDFRALIVNFAIFVPLNVAAVVSCFWLLRLFEFNERIAGLTSIILLLSTTVFHYAQVHQHNNQLLLFVTLGYATALACVLQGRPRFAIFSGLALGAAMLVRASSIVHVLTVFMFLLGCLVYKTRDKLKIFQVVGLWIVGFIPLALLARVCDRIRYGSFWTSGQSLSVKQLTTDPLWSGFPEFPANYPWIHDPHIGIFGVLFTPAKSIFIYDPLLLPCLVLGIVFWQKLSPYIQWYLINGIFNLGLHIFLTSRLDFWHGDSAWGARYHVTSVHLLLIPLIALFIQRMLLARGLTQSLMRGFLILAIIVQMTSVILRPSAETGIIYFPTPQNHMNFRLGDRVVNIACLINSSFSEQCVNKQNNIHRVSLIPMRFQKSRNLAFLVWGLAVTMIIVTTVRFCLA